MSNPGEMPMRVLQSLTLFSSTLVALAAPHTVLAAEPSFGSGAILTNRLCNEPTGTNCALATPRTFTQFAGGLGAGLAASATNINNQGASGTVSVEFGSSYLPTIKAASFSGLQTRTGASADAFRLYTYVGAQAINLALTGSIHYITSGNDILPGEEAGAGIMNVNLAVLPVSAIALFGTTGAEIINAPGAGFTDCGGGAIAATYINAAGTIGENSATFNLSTTCSSGAITLRTGDSFVVYAGLQTLSNRGGFLDASHTFTVDYDPVNTVFTETGASVGAAYLAANVLAVPEPASWAMMIVGFGIVGAATRRTRSAQLQTANR
jgi:PEP-CTERM motif